MKKNNEKYRADLHYHGPIGFEPYWLRVQGYKGKNLLKLIADTCIKRGLDVCALTSETHVVDEKGIIERDSLHDRIGYLVKNYLDNLNKVKGYRADKFGENSIIVERKGEKVLLISGQTPIVMEEEKRFDYLVIGSNKVPNFMNIRDTQNYCNDYGLLHGLEHPALEAHFGIGLEKAKEYIDQSDFVEGHNAQLLWPSFMSRLPLIGPYTRLTNEKAKKFAEEHQKPWIATSDGHMIESAGRAFIEFNENAIEREGETALLANIKQKVRLGKFTTTERYENPIGWCEWVAKFQWGIRGERYKRG